MNLYFSGIIGSGKTTIGGALSARLGVPMFDLDREMDARLGYSFHRLVAEDGWLAFRELEYSICKAFADESGAIICLGGGTIRYEWNRDLFRGTGIIVHLEADERTLVKRVSRADRPRVNPDTDLAGDVHRILAEHGATYTRAANVIYRTDEKTLDEEIDELEAMVRTDARFAPFRSVL